MNTNTLLLRQVHSAFVKDDRVASIAFRPTPKDEKQLSVDNGDNITAEQSYNKFVSNPNCSSIGVLAVSKKECDNEALSVIEDGVPYKEHCSINFSGLTKKETETKAKILRDKAVARNWLFKRI
ncbi:MAG: hypothetical protein FWC26_05595 [Fibromonadales bacterium]|nr:hypothetical protein [Fibromonadales bacterium]